MSIVESYKARRPRILLFYLAVSALLITLACGLGYRQLSRNVDYGERERLQNQRRVLVPGPRGNIYDRNGRLLVGNRPRFAVTLYLDDLRREIRRESISIVKKYREREENSTITREERPTAGQFEQIARSTVVQRYLDQVNRILSRDEKVDVKELQRHFNQRLLLPYILLDDLKPEEYARLIESLPVQSPLQVYTSSTRHYPYNNAAAHTLGYVATNDELKMDSLPGEDLKTYALKGTVGKNGLELNFDNQLQGQTGGSIYRVDPAGYRVNPPIEKRSPVQGKNLITSINIDLQLAAEKELEKMASGLPGAAVALDVRTGEVLVFSSKPDFNLNDFSPRLTHAVAADIETRGAWENRALRGLYPPGSAFKILMTIAGMQAGYITPDSGVECTGNYKVGNRLFPCHNQHAHGAIKLQEAIEKSCNVFYYKYGLEMGPDVIADESKLFGFDTPTGIELPSETRRMLVPSPAWKKEKLNAGWFPGDTANFSIGQGDLVVTPLQMACFMASFARGETRTTPTLIHREDRPTQKTAPIQLPASYRAAIIQGMEQCTLTGTGKMLNSPLLPEYHIAGLRIAGKTGTAQKDVYEKGAKARINFAWFICFAPIEKPEIAIAVMIEGDTDGETGGGRYAVPVASKILNTWWTKRNAPPPKATIGFPLR